ncbi:sugar ABC transporter substrate-binding protein [Dorea sp. D27]|uniref:sugar ABC transporter substrate-binding protein n=1 Tax=Dorea sp. D27 TaxID=658665 RepID=UPI0006736309|nr:sugar ABC transporter substrate-binding protein [Dorea sp. D27]KMZ53538.1 putative periplasmic binding proteins and sugar binding domain of the LacI family protein [Dorea sp. D27]
MKKRIVSGVLMIAMMAVLILNGCGKDAEEKGTESGKDKKRTIACIVGNQTMDFFVNISKGAQKAAEEGDEVLVYSFDDDANKQSQIFEDCITKKVDAILTTILDSEAIITSLRKADQAGIPVITMDAYPDGKDVDDLYAAAVLDDLYQAGYDHGVALCEAIGGKGKIGWVWYTGASEVSKQRSKGFEDAVGEYPDVEIVAYSEGSVDTESCLSQISAQLQNYSDLDAYWAPWANAGMAAVTALASAGMSDVKLAISDCNEDLVQYVLDGKVIALMDLNAAGIGGKAMDLAYEYLDEGSVSEQINYVEVINVDESNIADYQ